MNPEYEVLYVRALDAAGYPKLATKVDNRGFLALTPCERKTAVETLESWKSYVRGDVDEALKSARKRKV